MVSGSVIVRTKLDSLMIVLGIAFIWLVTVAMGFMAGHQQGLAFAYGHINDFYKCEVRGK